MRDELLKLIAMLKYASTGESSKNEFLELLQHAIKLLNLSDDAIAIRFHASRPAVARWKNGSNAPHAALRSAVYEGLLTEATYWMQRFEQTA